MNYRRGLTIRQMVRALSQLLVEMRIGIPPSAKKDGPRGFLVK